MPPPSPSNCICSTDSVHTLLLPFIPLECTWNVPLRAILYLLGLGYLFMGVAIVSDIFMSAIEMIVSVTKQVPIELGDGEGKITLNVEVSMWNSTVANLTLMALGSSAPEILLSVIEIVGNDFLAGDLGPGTIVGSAAFNLLFISAACVYVVPDGETRRISIYNVFIITSAFSLFAYVWMLIVLDVISPNCVDIWEALVTLLCFPLLVVIAWWADHNFCFKGRKPRKSLLDKATEMQRALNGEPIMDGEGDLQDGLLDSDEHPLYVNGQINPTALIEFYKYITQMADVSDEEAASLIACKLIEAKEHSRLWYRIGACRGLMGGSKLQPILTEKLQEVYSVINEHHRKSTGVKGNLHVVVTTPEIYRKKAVLEFQAACLAVPENIGFLTVVVVRSGRADNEVTVRVKSIDGTANAGSDYVTVDEELVFEPFVYERSLSVKIIDDNQWEPEESFFLRLSLPNSAKDFAMLGQTFAMEITIIDDDKPGVLSFSKRTFLVNESSREVALDVERNNGCDGIVAVKWKTTPDGGKATKHPNPIEGKLTFQHGEKRKKLVLPLLASQSDLKNETFDVEMYATEGGATLGQLIKAIVIISNDEKFQDQVTKVVQMASTEVEVVVSSNLSYSDQIRGAFSVNGGNADEASAMDYILHFVTFFWKILFSLIPPPSYLGGWLCFVTSLVAIGVLTAIIGDLATIFGCLIGLKDTITAITFVALGTSLPDTFASMAAALQDKTADNAIGNVTGSNSVNVFLGLGIPWTLAAIYHAINGHDFEVKSGSLAFSVMVYSIVAVIALALLTMRRYLTPWGKAELGGPRNTKIITSLVLILLWFIYVGLSALQAYGFFEFHMKSGFSGPKPSSPKKP